MRNIRTFPQLLFRIFVRPVFPLGQWLALKLRFVTGPKSVEGGYERQPFLHGLLRTDIPLASAVATLKERGFFENRVAYIDPGQVASLRQLCEEYPDRQYHLRIFDDGEVRGHYEYTPEDHPIAHLDEHLFEPRKEQFAAFLEGLLR